MRKLYLRRDVGKIRKTVVHKVHNFFYFWTTISLTVISIFVSICVRKFIWEAHGMNVESQLMKSATIKNLVISAWSKSPFET